MSLKKILTSFVVLCFSFSMTFSLSGMLYASGGEIPVSSYQLSDPSLSAQPVTEDPSQTELTTAPSTLSPSSTDFLMTSDHPLSVVEEESASVYQEEISLDFGDLTRSNDPFFGTSGSWGQSYDDLWWLKRVNADDAWSMTRGAGSTVAVIDTGFDFNHPDIANNVWYNQTELNGLPGVDDDGNGFIDDVKGWDFQNNDNNPQDDNGHGTHVAGIIGALADNAIGIAGVAPESKILPVKVLGSNGSGLVTNVISAIRYAANLGVQVINLSLGVAKAFLSKTLQTSFQNAVKYALGKGAVVVAAAGNEGSDVKNSYPAGIHDVIAVGATDPTNQRAYFSNFGTELDFMAPGVDILSLRASGTSFGSNSTDPAYSRASGTSMASPIVAGVVALLKSWNPLMSFSEVYGRLRLSAVDLGSAGFDKFYGYGLVDAFGALSVQYAAASIKTNDSPHGNGIHYGIGFNGLTSPFIISKSSAESSAPHFSSSSWMGSWYRINALFYQSFSGDEKSSEKKKKSPS